MPQTNNFWDKLNSGKKRSNPTTERLQNTVNAQRNQINFWDAVKGTGKPGHGGPTVLNRIFDILGRPLYGVAGGVSAAQGSALKGGGGLGKIIHGVGSGLAGTQKKTFKDVLAQAGVKNKIVQGAGGFALDVALDPLSYVGTGLIKEIGEGALGAVSGKAYKAALESEGAKAAATAAKIETIANKTSKFPYKALAEDLAADPEKNKKILQKALEVVPSTDKAPALKTVAKDAKERFALQAANDAKEAARATGAGKIQLKFMGHPVAESERLYRVGQKAISAASKDGSVGNLLGKLFRNTAAFPEGTNSIRRRLESAGVAEWENEVKDVLRPQFEGLTKKEKEMIADAIENGDSLHGVLSESGKNLGEVQDWVNTHNRDLFLGEKAIGLHEGIDPLENYVYHNYRNFNTPEASKFRSARRAVGAEKPGFEMLRKIPTLQEAAEAGLKPVRQIDDIQALRLAKHNQVIARKQFVSEIGDRFGVQLEKASEARKLGLVAPVGDQRFLPKNTFFHPEISKVLENIERFHSSDQAASELIRKLDKIQNIWKFTATAANPGHHVRNFVGDSFLNYLDGVDNPYRYVEAAKALRKEGTFKVGKLTLEGKDIMREFVQAGGKSGFFRTEFAAQGAGLVEKIRELSETREDWARMAHFIDALKKEGKDVKDLTSLREAAIKAGERVRKFNIDYGDLTEFERRSMKRVIPFYTWLRKNIPLQLEMLALRPGRLAVVPKGQRAIEIITGQPSESTIGEAIPKWIKELSGIRVGESGAGNSIFWAPPLPVNDISRFTEGGKEGILRVVLSSTSPYLRIPIEQGTGQTLFSGAPIKDNLQYGSEQISMLRTLQQATSGRLTGLKALNYLLGLGVYENTPQTQQSELRRQQDSLQGFIAEIRRRNRERMGVG